MPCGKCGSNVLATEINSNYITIRCFMCGWADIFFSKRMTSSLEDIELKTYKCKRKKCGKLFKSKNYKKFCLECYIVIRKRQNNKAIKKYYNK